MTHSISFAKEDDLLEFARAIRASDNPDPELEYIVTSLNEWQQPQDRRIKYRKASERTSDEGREGYSYRLLRWPAFVLRLFQSRTSDFRVDFCLGVALVARVTLLDFKLLNYSRLCYAAVRMYVNLTEFLLTW